MPTNNQAQDRYSAPNVRSVDFEENYLRDLEVSELFWLKNDSADGNRKHAYRKLYEKLSRRILFKSFIDVK